MLMTCWETSFRNVISIDLCSILFTSKRVLRIWQNPQGSCHFKPAGNLGSRYLATLSMTALPSKPYLNSRASCFEPRTRRMRRILLFHTAEMLMEKIIKFSIADIFTYS